MFYPRTHQRRPRSPRTDRRMPASLPPLTLRQLELLELVAMGMSNAEIAEELVLSPHTVRKHLENVYQRLGVTNRTAAAAVYWDWR
jgi:DNA-binding NarL/FixJ family response regulator